VYIHSVSKTSISRNPASKRACPFSDRDVSKSEWKTVIGASSETINAGEILTPLSRRAWQRVLAPRSSFYPTQREMPRDANSDSGSFSRARSQSRARWSARRLTISFIAVTFGGGPWCLSILMTEHWSPIGGLQLLRHSGQSKSTKIVIASSRLSEIAVHIAERGLAPASNSILIPLGQSKDMAKADKPRGFDFLLGCVDGGQPSSGSCS
jgi:hypothetical protein